MPDHVGIAFGVFAPPIADQLQQQGLSFPDGDALEHLEKDRQAVVRLAIRGFLSEKEKERALARILKRLKGGLIGV